LGARVHKNALLANHCRDLKKQALVIAAKFEELMKSIEAVQPPEETMDWVPTPATVIYVHSPCNDSNCKSSKWKAPSMGPEGTQPRVQVPPFPPPPRTCRTEGPCCRESPESGVQSDRKYGQAQKEPEPYWPKPQGPPRQPHQPTQAPPYPTPPPAQA
jgi:hypothetical protein